MLRDTDLCAQQKLHLKGVSEMLSNSLGMLSAFHANKRQHYEYALDNISFFCPAIPELYRKLASEVSL